MDLDAELENLLQKKLTLENLLQKQQWTVEETETYVNKKLLCIEKELCLIDIRILSIDKELDELNMLLKKGFDQWTLQEKETYVSKDVVRSDKTSLLSNKASLLSEKASLTELYHVNQMQIDSSKVHPSPSRYAFFDMVGLTERYSMIPWTVQQLKRLVYLPTSNVFRLDPSYLTNSGLPYTKDLLLFCRPAFHDQFKFLQEQVIGQHVRGWILGPPGTGKSATTLAFVSTLPEDEWIITWIHLSRRDNPKCVRLENGVKKSCELTPNVVQDLFHLLDNVDSNKKHLVVIDGYTEFYEINSPVYNAYLNWIGEPRNLQLKYVVFVCSMSARYKSKEEDDLVNNVKEHRIYSWQLAEYLEAVKLDEFFESVSECLQSEDASISRENRRDLVEDKFYFSGGCSRYMFLYPLSKVKEFLSGSVDVVRNIDDYATAHASVTGPPSSGVINRLFSLQPLSDENILASRSFVVSQYVALLFSLKLVLNGFEEFL